ncbi:MAG: AAA family ATPase [Dialister pneumosintes]
MSRLTAIVSGKGGVGKSTLTAAIGITLARAGKKVLLIDGDLGLCNLDIILGVSDKVKHHIYELAQGSCFLEEVIISVSDNLDFIAGTAEQTWDYIFEGAMDTVLEDLGEIYDYILLDCPAGIGRGIEYVKQHADDVILIQLPTKTSQRDALHTREFLRDHILIWVLLNEFTYDNQESLETVLEQIDREKLLGVVPYSKKISILSNQGNFINETYWGVLTEAMQIIVKNYMDFKVYPNSTWMQLLKSAEEEILLKVEEQTKKREKEKQTLLSRMVYKWGRRRW